jgi:excisionase family DNA binding protein
MSVTRHLVTLKEAVAVRPWLTERYARRLIGERRIPFHKLGSKVLLDLADLDAFAEAGRVEAVREPSRDTRPNATTTKASSTNAGVQISRRPRESCSHRAGVRGLDG